MFASAFEWDDSFLPFTSSVVSNNVVDGTVSVEQSARHLILPALCAFTEYDTIANERMRYQNKYRHRHSRKDKLMAPAQTLVVRTASRMENHTMGVSMQEIRTGMRPQKEKFKTPQTTPTSVTKISQVAVVENSRYETGIKMVERLEKADLSEPSVLRSVVGKRSRHQFDDNHANNNNIALPDEPARKRRMVRSKRCYNLTALCADIPTSAPSSLSSPRNCSLTLNSTGSCGLSCLATCGSNPAPVSVKSCFANISRIVKRREFAWQRKKALAEPPAQCPQIPAHGPASFSSNSCGFHLQSPMEATGLMF